MRKFISALQERARAEVPHRLSFRESQVMEHLAKGLTEKEAADALHVKPHTIHKMAKRAYSKLHVHNRDQAIAEYRAHRTA